MIDHVTPEKPHPEPDSGNESVTPEKTDLNSNNDSKNIAQSPVISEHHDEEAQPHLHAKTFLAVFAVCLIYFAQDFTIVGCGAQGQTIAAHFDASGSASWVTAPIAILTVVLGPPISQASNYWGRKPPLIILTLLGALGSLLVALSTSMSMVIAGVTIIGTAFGAQPLLHTVASEVLPRRWRSWAQAAVMIANGLALASGLLIGGALNRHGDPRGFRYFFYIAMSLFLASALITFFTYQPLPTSLQTSLTFKEKAARLDWTGYLLLAASLVLFCMGLSWSQNPYGWNDAHVSATFALGVVLAGGLGVWEGWWRRDGMFHHGLFRENRNFGIALFCVFCEGIAFFAANIYFAFQVSVLYETDTLIVGVRFAIAFLATIVASGFTGLYCAITKKVRMVTFVAFVIFTAFFICIATATKDSSTAVWGYPVLMGWALGMTLTTLVTVAQLSTPPELIAVASGLIISVRSLGGTIGIAIYNAVFTSATTHLPTNVGKAAAKAGLPPTSIPQFIGYLLGGNTTGLSSVPGVSPAIIGSANDARLDTFATGFRNVWVSALGFIVLAAVASLFLFDPSEQFNNHIDAPVEKDEDMYSI